MPHVALSIAGSDCSAGAGIQADLKTFQHFHVHGLTAISCVVSETANTFHHIHPVPPDVLADQIHLLLDSFPVAAIKTGMLYSRAHIIAVSRVLSAHAHIPLVVDPVMIASTGNPLIEPEAIEAYHSQFLSQATLITPNLPEAETLLGVSITHPSEIADAARTLAEQYSTNILLKGGHLNTPDCLDLLCSEEGEQCAFSSPRIPSRASHGTGCTLSAAITAGLACGKSLPAAVADAKDYLNQTLRTSYSLEHPHHIFQSLTVQHPQIDVLNQGTVPFHGK